MSEANWYGTVFKSWQAKLAGSKPTAEMLATAHAFGKPGKQSLALAMAMRDEGVTNSQIMVACGNPQNNHRRGLIEAALFKRLPVAPAAAGHTVYKIELTAKGNAAIQRREAAVAKVTAAGDAVAPKVKKATSKPRKPVKAVPDTGATVEPVNETPVEQATA